MTKDILHQQLFPYLTLSRYMNSDKVWMNSQIVMLAPNVNGICQSQEKLH